MLYGNDNVQSMNHSFSHMPTDLSKLWSTVNELLSATYTMLFHSLLYDVVYIVEGLYFPSKILNFWVTFP